MPVLSVGNEDRIDVHQLAQELVDGLLRARMFVLHGAGYHAKPEAPAEMRGVVRNAWPTAAAVD